MQNPTSEQFTSVLTECRNLFIDKLNDYGATWRIFRLPSITDQMYIKAERIRNLQQNKVHLVEEGVYPEFVALVNYSTIALIQSQMGAVSKIDLNAEEALSLYDQHSMNAFELMKRKNHDYGEAWRNMRISSITDLILVKLLRIKQIEDNNGNTKVSEGAAGNYMDILNYAVFALILLKEEKNH